MSVAQLLTGIGVAEPRFKRLHLHKQPPSGQTAHSSKKAADAAFLIRSGL